MTGTDLLIDAFGRIREVVHRTANGLSPTALSQRLEGRANSIAWLLWHLTRVQDDHVADAAGMEQVWISSDWWKRFALPFDQSATGYGHSSEEVAAVRPESPGLLVGYHDAVYEQTVGFVQSLSEGDLDRIVDTSWDPPVSLGVRLVSVIADDLQHAGQAAFIRGILERG